MGTVTGRVGGRSAGSRRVRVCALAALVAIIAGCGSRGVGVGVGATSPAATSRPSVVKSSLRHQPSVSRKATDDVVIDVVLACAPESDCAISEGVVHVVEPVPVDLPISASGATAGAVLPASAAASGSVSYWIEVTTAVGERLTLPDGAPGSTYVVRGTPTNPTVRSVDQAPPGRPTATVSFGWGSGATDLGLIPAEAQGEPTGPGGLTVAANGDAVILDSVNHRLVRVSVGGKVTSTPVDVPEGWAALFATSQNQVLVFNPDGVRIFDLAGKAPYRFIPAGDIYSGGIPGELAAVGQTLYSQEIASWRAVMDLTTLTSLKGRETKVPRSAGKGATVALDATGAATVMLDTGAGAKLTARDGIESVRAVEPASKSGEVWVAVQPRTVVEGVAPPLALVKVADRAVDVQNVPGSAHGLVGGPFVRFASGRAYVLSGGPGGAILSIYN